MRKWFLLFCVLGTCDGFTTFYGSQGQFAGTANSIAGLNTYYGPEGQFVGSSDTIGGSTNFYGPQGQYEGSALNARGFGDD